MQTLYVQTDGQKQFITLLLDSPHKKLSCLESFKQRLCLQNYVCFVSLDFTSHRYFNDHMATSPALTSRERHRMHIHPLFQHGEPPTFRKLDSFTAHEGIQRLAGIEPTVIRARDSKSKRPLSVDPYKTTMSLTDLNSG